MLEKKKAIAYQQANKLTVYKGQKKAAAAAAAGRTTQEEMRKWWVQFKLALVTEAATLKSSGDVRSNVNCTFFFQLFNPSISLR